MTTLSKEVIEKSVTPHLAEFGSDQYVFVMYDVKSLQQNQKWYIGIVVNSVITLIQNVAYVLVRRTGVAFAKYLYRRVLREYMTQYPLKLVLQFGIDLTKLDAPQTEEQQHLKTIIDAQIKLLNPHLKIADAQDFLTTLGQEIITNPPSRFTLGS